MHGGTRKSSIDSLITTYALHCSTHTNLSATISNHVYDTHLDVDLGKLMVLPPLFRFEHVASVTLVHASSSTIIPPNYNEKSIITVVQATEGCASPSRQQT